MRKREPYVRGVLRLTIEDETEFWITVSPDEIERTIRERGFEDPEFWIDALGKFLPSFRGAIHGYVIEFFRVKERYKDILRISAITTEGDLTRVKVIDILGWLKEKGLTPSAPD